MSPASAEQCVGDFEAWRAAVQQEAREAGVGARALAALAGARIDQSVLERDRSQGVFMLPFTEFSRRLVSSARLQQGTAHLRGHAELFGRVEREYGVPGPVMAAFWALETDFGAVQGGFRTLDALVTLAHDCRRPQLFRPHVVPLLILIDRGDLPADVQGAWAGEIGQTQMLPRDILTYGVDGDGDGRIDLRRSVPDAILTAAHKLREAGWRRGEPWIEEVRVPPDLPWEEADHANKRPVSEWAARGVTSRDGSPLDAERPAAGLVLPEGHRGPAFLAYPNFDIYLAWNESLIYTLTAAHLATRFAGAPPFDPRNPEPGLNRDDTMRLQEVLVERGHDVGGVDGLLGAMTRAAVRAEQRRLGLPADGWPTSALLKRLERDSR